MHLKKNKKSSLKNKLNFEVYEEIAKSLKKCVEEENVFGIVNNRNYPI